jgi:D-glycero-alpha-D-manno-heptose 1-phosphate guanylyltransferase
MGKESIVHPKTAKPHIIILAGGLGTRLRSVVADLPKCMAPVNGKPFLSYVIDYFLKQGVEKFIFAVGYKHEVITVYLETLRSELVTNHSSLITDPSSLIFEYSIEDEPLGTGGAIKKACTYTSNENVLVANGDTLFTIDTLKLLAFHVVHNADCTLALKPMKDFSRYGAIELYEDHSIRNFNEKKFYEQGVVNGGVYVLNRKKFLQELLPEKFSFETDYLEPLHAERKMYGLVQDEYFIDIGIPEDYDRAQRELGLSDV